MDISKEIYLQSRSIYTSTLLFKNISFKLSDIGEGIREVAVKEWFVKVGDKVSQFDNICEVQSDKASVTITSRYDGVITKLHYAIDETALVGKPLVDIETDSGDDTESSSDDEKVEKKTEEKIVKSVQQTSPSSYKKDICIPSVRRLAKEHSVDLSLINGSGKDGRILKEDVLNFLKSPELKADAAPSAPVHTPKSVQADRTVPVKGFQKAMVKTMTESLKIPDFVYSDEVAVTKLAQLRQAVKEECLKSGVKISYMPFFIKAASNGLLKYPVLNASVDSNCENITYKSSHNIGIAMDTKVGLAVPVIKNVQDLSVIEIAKELNRLMISGKEGTFSASDLTGGTFAISNIGVIGGTYTKPVILPPQVAIIALGTSRVLPRFDADMKVIPEEIICVSGAADHRVVDGVSMASFINLLKKQIENPYLLFLNL